MRSITTADHITFNDTQEIPINGNVVTKEWLVFKPLVKGLDYSSDFAFRQAGVRFGTGSANDTVDHTMMWGWNLNEGGGLKESSVVPYNKFEDFPIAGNYNTIYRDDTDLLYYNWNGFKYEIGNKRGRTAIGFSLEDRFNAYNDGDMYTESHQYFVDCFGKQIRISSYTGNTSNNNITLYRTVSREWLYYPTPPGQPKSDIQYWAVQPGAFMMTDAFGVQSAGMSIETGGAQITLNSNSKQAYIGGNVTDISFSGKQISNLSVFNASLNRVEIVYANLSSNIKIGDWIHYSPKKPELIVNHYIDPQSNIEYINQGFVKDISYYNLNSINLGGGYIKGGGFYGNISLPQKELVEKPQNGAFEFDGTHLYITIGGVRKQLDN